MENGFLSYWDGDRKVERMIEFGFGIKSVRDGNKTEYVSAHINEGISLEVVIQRMKMLLFQLERKYANAFDKTHSKMDDKQNSEQGFLTKILYAEQNE